MHSSSDRVDTDAQLNALERDAGPLTLLWADAHRFGAGKVHVYSPPAGKTRCGKTRVGIPGRLQGGTLADVTCRGCLMSFETERRRKRERAERQQRQAEWQAERDEERRRWWQRYNRYLETPEWHSRREKVLERANGRCEGCGERRAAQVHHRTYEHVGDEFLFELVALCELCHER